jgi:membrane-associated phospholipid phosphatase
VKNDNRLILLLSSAAFLCCSVMAGAGLFHTLDVTILGLAQQVNSAIVDKIGLIASVVGGVEFVAVAAIILAAGLFVQGQQRLATRFLAALMVTGLIEIVFKMMVPQAPVPEDALRGPDPSLLDISTPYPYPSGHMLRAVLLLGAIYLLWPNGPVRLAIVAFLVVSAASRLYLGTHWPSDILGGALLGIAGLAWVYESRQPGTVRAATARR